MSNPSWFGSTAIVVSLSAASSTQFARLTGLLDLSTTEANQQTPSLAGAYSKFGVRVQANSRLTTTTFRFRINAASGNQVISVTSGSTGQFVDSTNSDTVSAGDLVNYSVTTGTGGSIISFSSMSAVFTPASGGAATPLVMGSVSFLLTGTSYMSLHGRASAFVSTEDARVQQYMMKGGTLSRLFAKVTANTKAATTTINSRINGSNGAMSLSVPASTTGFYQDTSNTDTIATGDYINYSIANANSGTVTITTSGAWLQAGSNDFGIYSRNVAGTSLTTGATVYATASGAFSASTTESETNQVVRATIPITGISIQLYVNNSSTFTATLRANTANTSIAVSVPSSTSGVFTASGSATVSDGDVVDIALSSMSSTQAIVQTALLSSAVQADAGSALTGISQSAIVSRSRIADTTSSLSGVSQAFAVSRGHVVDTTSALSGVSQAASTSRGALTDITSALSGVSQTFQASRTRTVDTVSSLAGPSQLAYVYKGLTFDIAQSLSGVSQKLKVYKSVPPGTGRRMYWTF